MQSLLDQKQMEEEAASGVRMRELTSGEREELIEALKQKCEWLWRGAEAAAATLLASEDPLLFLTVFYPLLCLCASLAWSSPSWVVQGTRST